MKFFNRKNKHEKIDMADTIRKVVNPEGKIIGVGWTSSMFGRDARRARVVLFNGNIYTVDQISFVAAGYTLI